ncbi:MAG: S-adenosylmethionine:tRNA ribosyltransferase-isomerase [Bacteroidota bacterium]
MRPSAKAISIADYVYELPDDRIARHPLPERDSARQLVYRNGEITEGIFRNLADRLPEGTLLIGNKTRVIHARMHFPLGEGKRPIEVFCLDPLEPVDYQLSLGARTQVQWKCLIGGNRRWKRGPLHLEVTVNGQPVTLTIERGERLDNTFAIGFRWTGGSPDLTFGEVLAAAGKIPLPPYLGRDTEAADHDRYQTVFAKTEGSVAAPTAGLHFTPYVLDSLAAKQIDWAEITLHVGAGTFKPVDSETLADHTMHREYFSVSRDFVARLEGQLIKENPVVCVGTTSLRCVESLYYLGASFAVGELMVVNGPVAVDQWVTEEDQLLQFSPAVAFRTLGELMDTNGLDRLEGYTQLLITPAATLRIADGIITNFHQPSSTLLLLIAAFVGDDWRKIYDYALGKGFRFLSYGDSSLLWKRLGRSSAR